MNKLYVVLALACAFPVMAAPLSTCEDAVVTSVRYGEELQDIVVETVEGDDLQCVVNLTVKTKTGDSPRRYSGEWVEISEGHFWRFKDLSLSRTIEQSLARMKLNPKAQPTQR